jgi:serine/threonine-protein kinase
VRATERRLSDDLLGAVIGGYRLDRRIGGGQLSRIYHGRHERLARGAAVKILNPSLALDDEAVSRFFCEARAVAEVGNDHLPDIYDFIYDPKRERVAYAMEYLAGDDLRRTLDKHPVLSPGRAAHLGVQLCDALGAIHACGVVHRDVRPSNLMLIRRGGDPDYLKLIDFGVAQFSGKVHHHTAAGVSLGSPVYMSPEYARGQRVDGRADLYSVGVLLHEMLTGAPPFLAQTSAATIELHLHGRVPSAAGNHGAGEVPRPLAEIVRRCLSKAPGDRYATAEQLRGALLDALHLPKSTDLDEQTHQVPLATIGPPQPRLSRARSLGFGVAFAAGLVSGLLITYLR